MLTNRSYSYIVLYMNIEQYKISNEEMENRLECFAGKCREMSLKVTPQRLAVYQELLESQEHPSAEMVFKKIRKKFPSISLDTVNRTLLTLNDIGAAFIVEGSGDAKRYDGGLNGHQHFKCTKCKRIVDFHHKPFDDIKIPSYINRKFRVIRKTVYIEGICDICLEKGDSQKKQSNQSM